MQGINILGTGLYVPEKIMTNEDFSKIVETNDEWITTRTGIKQRHISTGHPTWYLGVEAAKKALEVSNTNPDEIDLIVISTTTPDYYTPSCSCIVQRELNLTNAMTIDINCACTGYVYALDMARRYLFTGDVKKALVISTENPSTFIDYDDRATCILFGDGAAACIVEASDKLYASFLGADGNGAKHLISRHNNKTRWHKDEERFDDKAPETKEHYLFQDGKEVYKFATKILPFAANKTLERVNLTPEDISFFIPHQANLRIIQTAASNLGVSMDKFYVTLDKYGNTSSSSIPIAFDEAVKNGIIKRGDKICMIGFGAGLTYGAIVLEY